MAILAVVAALVMDLREELLLRHRLVGVEGRYRGVDTRRWWGNLGAQEEVRHEHAATGGRALRRVPVAREVARMAHEAFSVLAGGHRDLLETTVRRRLNTVERGQIGVDEGVIGVEDSAIVGVLGPDDIFEEAQALLPHGLSQLWRERRE